MTCIRFGNVNYNIVNRESLLNVLKISGIFMSESGFSEIVFHWLDIMLWVAFIIRPQTVFVEGYTVFMLSVHPKVHPSIAFWFLLILLKNRTELNFIRLSSGHTYGVRVQCMQHI